MTYSDPFIDLYASRQREYHSGYEVLDAFTEEEVQSIIEIGEDAHLFEGLVGGADNVKRKHIRDSIVGFLEYDEETSWIFDRIAKYVLQANEEMWDFDLTGFGDGLQYTKYFGGGGHYDWHSDVGYSVPHRKLSMVVQLSDELEYEGGTLQLNVGSHWLEVSKKKGSLVIFPSFVLHRVTPVSSGVRQSLVSWISGPNFK